MGLSQLLDTLPLASFLLDARENITLANKQAAELWGLNQTALIGINLNQFFTLAGYPETYEATARLLREKKPEKVTFFAHRQQQWIEVTAIRAATGAHLYFTDITALKAATQGRQSLRQVLDAAPDLYLILSAALIIEMVSDAYLAATRTRREQLVGQYAYDWLRSPTSGKGENALQNTLLSFEKVLRTKRPDVMPVQHYDVPDETGQLEPRFWSPVNTPVLDDQGEVRYIIHKVNDITDLVRSQQEARELAGQNTRLNQLIEHAIRMEAESRAARRRLEEAQQIGHIGSFEWTSGSEAAYCSDELYRIYGLAPQSTDMNLPRVLQYVHPQDREWLEQEITKARKRPQTTRLSHRIIRIDGEVRFLNWQFESLADARGHIATIRGTVQDITEQKRTDLILNTINEVCFELDEHFNFIYANREAFTSWRKTAAEVLGRNIWEVFPQEVGTPFFEALNRAAASNTQVMQEVYCPEVGRWIFLNATPSPVGLIVLHFDVTEQVEDRRRLSEQQEQYRVLVENIPDVVTRWDRNLKLAYANSAFETKTGFPNEHLPGLTDQEKGQPGDIARPWMEKLKQVFDSGQDQSHYNAFPAPSGTSYFYSQVVPERATDGSVQTVLAITRDITDLKEAEAEITSAKALLQSVFDASANGIYLARAVRGEQHEITDFEFRLTNQAFTNLLGQEAAGKRYHDLYPQDQDAGIFDKLKQVVETGDMLEEERCYDREGTKQWFHMIAVRMEDGIVATFGDITHRKRQEEAITKHLNILQQSEELAQMGSWEYDVASGTFLWSEGMYRLFHLPPGSPVSPEIYRQHVLQQDRAIAESIIRSIQDTHQPFEETLRIKIRGARKTLRLKGVVIPDTEGRPAKVLGVDLDITQVRRLEQENLTMKLHQQKALMLAILEAQETERKRIAEGLHNGVGQLLYAAKLNLDQVPLDPMAPNLAQLADYKQKVDHLLLEAISETRRISHELMPGILEDLGLEAALEDICRKYSSESLALQCRVYKIHRPLEKHLQLAIYRMAQELANNIVKHAGASKASLQLRQKDRYLALLAEDNGIGFAPEPVQTNGMGLKTIRDRVNLLNGTMEIDSQAHKGTLISIYLPHTPGI